MIVYTGGRSHDSSYYKMKNRSFLFSLLCEQLSLLDALKPDVKKNKKNNIKLVVHHKPSRIDI